MRKSKDKLNENESYLIWSMMNVHYINDMGFQGERTKLAIYPDFIKNLSPEIKTIITFYSKFIYVISEEERIIFAGALGDFAKLEDAQKILLEDKEHVFEKIKKKLENNFLMYLKMKISGNVISFEYGGEEADNFIIENGNIIIK